jgi:hypothetical protein
MIGPTVTSVGSKQASHYHRHPRFCPLLMVSRPQFFLAFSSAIQVQWAGANVE